MIAVKDWPKHHPWPSAAALYHMIANAETNGIGEAIVKVGAKRYVIDEAKLLGWIRAHGGEPNEPSRDHSKKIVAAALDDLVPAADVCRRCKFWARMGPAGEDPKGTCRRYAPRPTFPSSAKVNLELSEFAEWPTVMHDGWCGEFKPRAGA